MDDPISFGVAMLIALFLLIVAAIAYHTGADFIPTLKAVGASVAVLGCVGVLWRGTGWFTVPSYLLSCGLLAWPFWHGVLDSISVNISLGLANKGLIERAFSSGRRDDQFERWGLPSLTPEAWYTSWQFQWGIEALILIILVAIVVRERRRY